MGAGSEENSNRWERAYQVGVALVVALVLIGGVGRLVTGPGGWAADVLALGVALGAGAFLGSMLAMFVVPLFGAFAIAALDDPSPASGLHAGFKWAAEPIPKWIAIAGPFLGLAAAAVSVVWRMQVFVLARVGFVALLFGIPLMSLAVMSRGLKDADSSLPVAAPAAPVPTGRALLAGFGGAFLGFVVSLVVSKGLASGAALVFPGDSFESPFREHPIIRVVFGALSSLVGGYVAGNIAPRWARWWAVASGLLPATLWLVVGTIELSLSSGGAELTFDRALGLASVITLPVATVVAAYWGGVVGERDALRPEGHRSAFASVRLVHWLWLLPVTWVVAHLAAVSTATSLTSTFSYADLSLARILGVPQTGWDWVGLPRPAEMKSLIVGLVVGLIGAFPVKRLLVIFETLVTPGKPLVALGAVLLNLGGAAAVVAVAQFFLNVTGWSPLPTIQKAEERISRRQSLRAAQGAKPEWLGTYQRFAADLSGRPDSTYSFKFACGSQERPFECENTIKASDDGVVLRVLRPWEEADGGVTRWEFRIVDRDVNGVPDEAEIWEGLNQSCVDLAIPATEPCVLRAPRNDIEDPILESYATWDMSIVMALEEQGLWISGRRLLPTKK
jgi:hypothetical protein